MHSIAAAATPVSDQIWRAFLALRRLDEAADAVSAAAALTERLSIESQWCNDGLSPRALREALEELHDSIVRELSDVRRARGELEWGMGA